ncbi:hypothetical protein Tco_0657511 [Tanacetum coccineum]|uniref:Retrovirus-related Pol polyprotein from transposon TNT 1-94 n=1 Tax=Tanacetum coccineum TaxID=301880 RepID=A0ABQ4XD49_9ASTR
MTMSIPSQESWALLEDLALYDNESWNDPKDFAKPVKAIALPQDVPSTSDRRLIELENQVQRLMEAHLAPTQPTQGIKSPSKLLSPKYLSQSSIIEQNKNPSSPKRVHFVNSIVILNKEKEDKEEGSVEPSKTKYTNRENANESDEEVESEKEFKEETKGETEEEEEEDNLEHFDTFPTMKELSVIDHYLGSVVFGKSFMEATELVYNIEEGTVMFERDKERILFKMPHKIDMFKHVDFMDRGTDSIPPFIIESHDDNCEKTYYSDSLDLGPKYKYDEYPKIAEGDAKPESQWTPDERRVVVQDQRLKSIIMSCLPDDVMECVISCVSAKETWTDLVHSFEGPLDTKENRIMDLKLEYQTFRAKSTESLLQTYTRYKTLINELANDGVNLSKHEINVGFVNSLPEKWLTFSQGLRNANHTQTLDLADIYRMFVYEDNLIQRRYSNTKKALITTPSSTPISTAFFSNNAIQDFQKNSDDEVDERTSEEYLRDLDIEYHERALLANSKYYKAEYKKMKAKLVLLEASPSSSQNPKTFQPNNKGLVAETFDWDEEEVSNKEGVTQVKVLMALADDELTVGKSHARNGKWVDITIRKVNTLLSMDKDADWQNYLKDELLILKQAKLDAVTFQIQNTKLIKLNHALQEQLKEEKMINEKWLTSSKKVSQCISEHIPHQKKKVLGGELLTESSSNMNENENLFVHASMGYDQEMVPKTKDWVERLNLNSKLLNFNNRRILVPESQAVNESLETLNTSESSKDSEAEFLTPLPPLKSLQGASSSSEVMSLTFQPHSPKERLGLGIMKHTKPETQDSSNESVSGTVTVNESKQITSLVPTEVKDT